MTIEPVFMENPIVTKDKGYYLAVYDCDVAGAKNGYHGESHSVGFTWSRDGMHWTKGQHVIAQPYGPANWSSDIRTPLGLVPEGNERFTLVYTGKVKDRNYYAIGVVTVKLSLSPAQGAEALTVSRR